MADLSAISALSSLSERDLYYQYLINHNSTSTMLNALSGNYSDVSDGTSMAGIMGAVSQAYSSSGLSSVLGPAFGMADNGDISSLGAISSFSSILKLYLNSEASEAANMAEKLSDVLETADEAGESMTNSYKTVQEIYKYFVDKSSLAAQALNKNSVASSSQAASSPQAQPSRAAAVDNFDFDTYINNIDKQIENSINATVASTGISMV